ncbi:hypothetical protein FRC09_020427 [Ceratobasidium sp. 395]|nr:hypothetical protein FRC09_020427 [Ceratobasidium sp. 395]
MASPVRLRVTIEYDGPQAGYESVIESLGKLKISPEDLSTNCEVLPSAASSSSTSALPLPESSTSGDSSISESNIHRKSLKKYGRKSEPILPTQIATSVELPERASSEPPPDQPERVLPRGKQRCEAYNASDGELCKIQIRAGLFPSLCHVHIKTVLKQPGFYPHANLSTLVKFEDWIPTFLSKRTQAGLRKLMAKPPEVDDKLGFVYAFEITSKFPSALCVCDRNYLLPSDIPIA